MSRTQKTKGSSLAKGPVGLVGLALLLYGVTAVIFGGHSFAQHAPSGAVHGKIWLGLEVNGWSGVLFIAAGLLLLLGAPLHWAAKGMSLVVGLALGAAALVSLVRGHGVLGLFAANHLTELVWCAAAALLILLSLLPRVGARTNPRYDHARAERAVETEPSMVKHEPTLARTGPVERERLSGNGARTNPRAASASGTTAQSYDTAAASHGRNGTFTSGDDTARRSSRSDPPSPATAVASEPSVRTTVLAVQTSTPNDKEPTR
jgi:hypothetical protein